MDMLDEKKVMDEKKAIDSARTSDDEVLAQLGYTQGENIPGTMFQISVLIAACQS